jgi:hypothetical protein
MFIVENKKQSENIMSNRSCRGLFGLLMHACGPNLHITILLHSNDKHSYQKHHPHHVGNSSQDRRAGGRNGSHPYVDNSILMRRHDHWSVEKKTINFDHSLFLLVECQSGLLRETYAEFSTKPTKQ